MFFPKDELDRSDSELLLEFIAQFYLGSDGREIPRSILLSHRSDDANLLAETLSSKVGRKVQIAANVRSQRAQWLKLAEENASPKLLSPLIINVLFFSLPLAAHKFSLI